jgi:hypothetical protein
VSGSLLGWYGNRDSFTRLKWWIVWKVTPWFEEKASLDLEWRTYAQKHNAAGKRPRCVYEGMENDLDPDEKVEVYEFPGGDPDAPPDCLIEAQARATKQKGLMRRKTAGLDADN